MVSAPLERIRHRSAGFTLLELLIAMSMFSLLLLLVFSALRTGARSTETVTDRLQQFEAGMQAERFFASVVRQAHPSGAVSGTGGLEQINQASSAVFIGGAERVILVAPGRASFARSGLYRYEVFALPSEIDRDRRNLWVRIDPFRPEMEEVPLSEPRLLLEDVEKFELSYFGIPPDSDEGIWTTEWPAELESMPQLVSLYLQPAGVPERLPVFVRPEAAWRQQ